MPGTRVADRNPRWLHLRTPLQALQARNLIPKTGVLSFHGNNMFTQCCNFCKALPDKAGKLVFLEIFETG